MSEKSLDNFLTEKILTAIRKKNEQTEGEEKIVGASVTSWLSDPNIFRVLLRATNWREGEQAIIDFACVGAIMEKWVESSWGWKRRRKCEKLLWKFNFQSFMVFFLNFIFFMNFLVNFLTFFLVKKIKLNPIDKKN